MSATVITAQKYNRLASEYEALRHVHPDDRTAGQAARLPVLARELSAILAVPPAGYALPKLATDLMAHAVGHGWKAAAQWSAPDYDDDPFVRVDVGRRLDGLERGSHWLYQLTWHSRGCSPGKFRLFGSGLAETPGGSSGWHDAPSVKAIRAVITANPGPDAATTGSAS